MFGKHMTQLTFSYMALNDLSSSISQRYSFYSFDSALEPVISERVLELLGYPNSEVKNLAVST